MPVRETLLDWSGAAPFLAAAAAWVVLVLALVLCAKKKAEKNTDEEIEGGHVKVRHVFFYLETRLLCICSHGDVRTAT